MVKFLKILAYVWGYIVCGIIIIAIIGNIISIPKGLPFYSYLWQVWLKIIEPFNPFNIRNFLATIILLTPSIILFWLADKIANRKLMNKIN